MTNDIWVLVLAAFIVVNSVLVLFFYYFNEKKAILNAVLAKGYKKELVVFSFFNYLKPVYFDFIDNRLAENAEIQKSIKRIKWIRFLLLAWLIITVLLMIKYYTLTLK